MVSSREMMKRWRRSTALLYDYFLRASEASRVCIVCIFLCDKTTTYMHIVCRVSLSIHGQNRTVLLWPTAGFVPLWLICRCYRRLSCVTARLVRPRTSKKREPRFLFRDTLRSTTFRCDVTSYGSGSPPLRRSSSSFGHQAHPLYSLSCCCCVACFSLGVLTARVACSPKKTKRRTRTRRR